MPHTQLTADRRDEVSQVGAMPDVGQERSILLVDRGPVGALHAGVIKEFALDAPGLAKNLGPLGLRLHLHLQRRDVQRAVADLRGPVGRHDAPARGGGAARLIEELRVVARKGVGADPLEEGRRRALAQAIAIEAQRRGRAGAGGRQIEDRPGDARFEVTVVAGRHVEGEDPLADPLEVDAHRDGRVPLRPRRGCGTGLVARLGQEGRRVGRAQHDQIDRATHGVVQ